MFYRTVIATVYLLGTALSFPDSLYQAFDSSNYRELKAAKRHEDVLKRSDDIVTKRSIVLTYADDTAHDDDTTFAARVNLAGDRPTLFLEDFEHLLDMVDCSDSAMTLAFRDAAFFEKAKYACASMDEGLIVSSHSSCSDSSAHSVFNVSNIEYDKGNSRIVLSIHETTWLRSFPARKIEFGHTSDRHYIHRHDRLSGRASGTQSMSGIIEAAASTLIPTATPTANSVTFDLSSGAADTMFTWPSGPGANLSITAGCKKCTTKGQLVITQGEIELMDISDLLKPVLNHEQEIDFVQRGYFELELNGFEASVLLRAEPPTSVEFQYDLFSVPVHGFVIPKFGAAGVLFQPQLVFNLTINRAVELTWGFKVTVPDKSTIRLDIGQFNQSRTTGFNETTVSSLPFNANDSDIELTLQAGLRPFLPIGMSFFQDKLKVCGGPTLDLPYIDTTIAQLATSAVDANCETGKGQGSARFQDTFKNLTHISASVAMGVGFEFEADVVGFPAARFNSSVWSRVESLPTACLAFGRETGMVVATVAEEKADARDKPSLAVSASLCGFAELAMWGMSAVTAIVAVL
ncbi:hypothetical protein K505DRAFT_359395 [Melanomma pulvis-pyrius CBS 109.77]|uniref:GPI anchored protein n=1 Tax=Melanomma pulvis-pyrius CBS 109.77 TaxID=1314802 RepID=A0A6A6XJL1_9PLEO|nr:hypothetical protein K505DRAFT_359395 [Melanomma pulvis-pyrius CBS 109.77]